MRYQNADRVMQLALELQATRTGLSLDDIEQRFGIKRRTAQRMRDAILRSFPQTIETVDEERRRRWRIPPLGQLSPGEVSADELADLEVAVRLLRREGQRERAKSLERVSAKLKALLRPETARRIEPDLEILLEAEGLAMRPGPRPLVRGEVLETLRLAIKQGREVYVSYRKMREGRSTGRRLEPYGFLFGNRHYLVAMAPDRHPGEARLYALSHIRQVRIGEAGFRRDPAFSLQTFAERSFGVFQEQPMEVVWRFRPDTAPIARDYLFHPNQQMEQQRDGSLIVRFRAGGLTEMAWHLYTWGDGVEVLEPSQLKERLKVAHRHRNFRLPDEKAVNPGQVKKGKERQ